MSWQHWTVVVLCLLFALGNILLVGEERPPKTPEEAATAVVLWALLIFLVVTG